MLPLTISVPTLAALPNAAAQVQQAIAASGATIVAFEGEMGAGKTTLIRALAAAMGVPDDVSSPTFALVNEYRDSRNNPVYHFDFYRIDSVEEAERMGSVEYFDSWYLCLIEWPARVAPLLPEPRLEVRLEVIGSKAREIQLKVIN